MGVEGSFFCEDKEQKSIKSTSPAPKEKLQDMPNFVVVTIKKVLPLDKKKEQGKNSEKKIPLSRKTNRSPSGLRRHLGFYGGIWVGWSDLFWGRTNFQEYPIDLRLPNHWALGNHHLRFAPSLAVDRQIFWWIFFEGFVWFESKII